MAQTWAEQQVQALIAAGADALDAERIVARVTESLPLGADPATWLPADEWADIDGEDIRDARADWYQDDAVPARFKRLLDAS